MDLRTADRRSEMRSPCLDYSGVSPLGNVCCENLQTEPVFMRRLCLIALLVLVLPREGLGTGASARKRDGRSDGAQP